MSGKASSHNNKVLSSLESLPAVDNLTGMQFLTNVGILCVFYSLIMNCAECDISLSLEFTIILLVK